MGILKYFSTIQHDKITQELKKAFALNNSTAPLPAEDQALLEKMAAVIVHRKMSTPTIFFLESMGPMNFLGSQALHFLTPILALACPTKELEQAARLLEQRDMIPYFIQLIETKAQGISSSSP